MKYRQLLLLFVSLCLFTQEVTPIPSRVANRMIPSWWLNARIKKNCQSWTDCEANECCARPMLSTHSYCLPLRGPGQSCDASAMLLDFENEVYFDHCPCSKDLTCINMQSSSVCVDPDSLERIISNRPVPKPVKQ